MKTKVSYAMMVVAFILMLLISADNVKYTTIELAPVVSKTEYNKDTNLYSGSTAMQYLVLSKNIDVADVASVNTNVVTSENEWEDEEPDVTEAISIDSGFVPINSNMYASQPLNIRGEPNADADIVGYLDINDSVNIIAYDTNSNWVKIAYGDQEAYVNETYLSNQRTTRIDLGQYMLTGYCSCAQCCGIQTGITASGTHATSGRTIAADDGIPFGTKIEIGGHIYTVEDRGGAITNNHIDIYFDSHQEATNFAVQYSEVYMILE